MAATAIVIGSGMGGLATAQVLSRHFEQVLLLERDEPEWLLEKSALDAAHLQNKARPGVMQYNQLHAMLAKGLEVYDDIFEGRFSTTLIAAGAKVVNQLDSYLLLHPAAGLRPWLHDKICGRPVPVALATRHLFETTARRLLAENPKVKIMYGAAVTGLMLTGLDNSHGNQNRFVAQCGQDDVPQAAAVAADGAQQSGGAASTPGLCVKGVYLSDGTCLSAQLVVDASGRGSALPGWLAAAGMQRPRTSRATCDAGYAGWLCKLSPEVESVFDRHNIQSVVCFPHPPVRTLALLMRVEDGLCIAGVGGNEGEHPGLTSTEEEILEFARKRVWHPCIARLLAGSTFMGPVQHCHHLSSTWRHYEDITLPDGLLVIGDAICSLNPSYGQGMTIVATEAAALDQLLRKRIRLCSQQNNSHQSSSSSSSRGWLVGLNAEFQRDIFPTIKAAWGLAAGSDVRYPSAVSNEPVNNSVVDWLAFAYMMQLFRLAAYDAAVYQAFTRVLHLLEPPTTLLKPGILLKVLLVKVCQLMPAVMRGVVAPWLPSAVAAAVGLPHKKALSTANHEDLLQFLGVTD